MNDAEAGGAEGRLYCDHMLGLPWKASLACLPRSNLLSIVLPGYLLADRITLHLVKVGCVGAHKVEELPPQQLPP